MIPDANIGMNLFIKAQIEAQMQSYKAEQDAKLGEMQSGLLKVTSKNTELGEIIEKNNELL